MVYLTKIFCNIGRVQKRSNFIDTARVRIKAGGGGNGLPQYGGAGGRGSNMYLQANGEVTLKKFLQKCPNKRIGGINGTPSKQHCILGPPASDMILNVPEGVTVITDEGKLLADLCKSGDKVLVARGGEGGNRFNNFTAQKGNAIMVRLDLKLIADVGFVGYPNAGKSTLLRALSRAKPKVANYPFTTLRPELGIAEYEDFRKIKMADLPGLIEGAHLNRGMGHRFLKHIERTKFLLFIVDVHGFQFGPTHPLRSAFQTIAFLNKELELYRDDLLDKPTMLVLNKMDKHDSNKQLEVFKDQWHNYEDSIQTLDEEWRPTRRIQFDDIITISAMRGVDTDKVKNRMRQLIDFHDEVEFERRNSEIRSSVADDEEDNRVSLI